MASEEFSMRIRPSGEIILELEGLADHRIRDLLEYIEETLGPVRIIEGEDSGGGNVRLKLGNQTESEGEGEGDRHRLRIQDE